MKVSIWRALPVAARYDGSEVGSTSEAGRSALWWRIHRPACAATRKLPVFTSLALVPGLPSIGSARRRRRTRQSTTSKKARNIRSGAVWLGKDLNFQGYSDDVATTIGSS